MMALPVGILPEVIHGLNNSHSWEKRREAENGRQHAQNVGPNLFACNENIANVMPRGTAHAVMSCMHHTARAHRQAGHPMYMWGARIYLWMCHLCNPNNIYQN